MHPAPGDREQAGVNMGIVIDRHTGVSSLTRPPRERDISIRSTLEGHHSGWPELVSDQPLIEPLGD